MLENLDVVRMAQAMARHAGQRQAVVAQNVAHADTPGYKARDLVPFAEAFQPEVAQRATRPGHFNGSRDQVWESQALELPASANGNSVSLETELLRSVEVKRQHDRALAVYQHTLGILRNAIGGR